MMVLLGLIATSAPAHAVGLECTDVTPTGDAEGCIAVSGAGRSEGERLAVTGAGSSQGGIAVTGAGTAHGGTGIVVYGDSTGTTAIAVLGCASAEELNLELEVVCPRNNGTTQAAGTVSPCGTHPSWRPDQLHVECRVLGARAVLQASISSDNDHRCSSDKEIVVQVSVAGDNRNRCQAAAA